jgi:hypothetical protein
MPPPRCPPTFSPSPFPMLSLLTLPWTIPPPRIPSRRPRSLLIPRGGFRRGRSFRRHAGRNPRGRGGRGRRRRNLLHRPQSAIGGRSPALPGVPPSLLSHICRDSSSYTTGVLRARRSPASTRASQGWSFRTCSAT